MLLAGLAMILRGLGGKETRYFNCAVEPSAEFVLHLKPFTFQYKELERAKAVQGDRQEVERQIDKYLREHTLELRKHVRARIVFNDDQCREVMHFNGEYWNYPIPIVPAAGE